MIRLRGKCTWCTMCTFEWLREFNRNYLRFWTVCPVSIVQRVCIKDHSVRSLCRWFVCFATFSKGAEPLPEPLPELQTLSISNTIQWTPWYAAQSVRIQVYLSLFPSLSFSLFASLDNYSITLHS